MRTELHALLLDLAHLGERKHLKSAAVGQNRLVPVHELMQSAQLPNDFMAGSQEQVIGVRQQNLRADLVHLVRAHGLDGCLRADGHENGGLHIAVRQVQRAAARARPRIDLVDFKFGSIHDLPLVSAKIPVVIPLFTIPARAPFVKFAQQNGALPALPKGTNCAILFG